MLWSLMICCDIAVLLPVSVGGDGLRRCGGWLSCGLGWRSGLGGQEQDRQEGPYGGDGAGDEGAGGEAAQEGAGGGVLERLAEGRVAEGGDLAGRRVRGADGLVRDRRRRGGRARGQGVGEAGSAYG